MALGEIPVSLVALATTGSILVAFWGLGLRTVRTRGTVGSNSSTRRSRSWRRVNDAHKEIRTLTSGTLSSTFGGVTSARIDVALLMFLLAPLVTQSTQKL
jgi:hypothetical protein